MLRALKTFRNDYSESTAALLYRGTERLLVDNVWCLPCEDFLRQLAPGKDIVPSVPSSIRETLKDPLLSEESYNKHLQDKNG